MDPATVDFLGRAVAELGADALCLWREDTEGTATPVASVPPGWPGMPFSLAGQSGVTTERALGSAALALLPVALRLTRTQAPGVVVRARGSRGAGLLVLWEQGTEPPSDVMPKAASLLLYWEALARLESLDDDLSRTQRLLRSLFLAMPQGVVLVPRPGHAGLVNATAAGLLGLAPGDIDGAVLKSSFERLVERAESPEALSRAVSPLLAVAGAVRSVDLRLRDPETILRLTIFPASEARSLGWIWLIDDLTEMKLAERRIRLQAEQRRAQLEGSLDIALDAARMGAWAWYPCGDRLVWSDSCKTLFGIPVGEEIDFGRIMVCLHPEDRERIQRAQQRSMSTGADLDEEYRIVLPDGSERWIHSLARVFLEPDGTVERFEGVARDITARREAERLTREHMQALAESKRELAALNDALRRRALDAETAVRARDAMLRNVSHEFRTPLNHILGGVELLLPEASAGRPVSATWLVRIRDAAHGLGRMVDGILDLARLSAGSAALEDTSFSAAALVRECVVRAMPAASSKGLALAGHVEPEVPELMSGDVERLSRMMSTYVENAIKFTTTGSVNLTLGVDGGDAGDVVLRCTVSDTGAGVDPAMAEAIFEPFNQADGSTTRQHGGMGLGLATLRSMAILMGGNAGVASEPDRGSRFWFTVRLARVTHDPALLADAEPGQPTSAPDIPREYPPEIVSTLRELAALLDTDDLRAVGLLARHKGALHAALEEQVVSPLINAVEAFDFSRAAALTKSLLDHAPAR